MLGPEQVNLNARSSPIFLEGVVAIKISEQLAKQLGLRDNQIVRGVIENRGDLLKLMINNKEIEIGLEVVATEQVIGSTFVLRLQNKAVCCNPSPFPIIFPLQKSHYQTDYCNYSIDRNRPLFCCSCLCLERLSHSLSFSPSGSSQQIGQLLSSMGAVSPSTVKNALINSGLFTESHLAKKQFIKQDIKVVSCAIYFGLEHCKHKHR